MSPEKPPYTLRHPLPEDGKNMWELVKNNENMDLNSIYYYLYFSYAFSKTSLIAEKNNKLSGLITGLNPPEKTDSLFIWQICVSPHHRGKGLALSMLKKLTDKNRPRWVEASINPSNKASIALFTALAKSYETESNFKEVIFPSRYFGKQNHESEVLFSIGPLSLC